MEAVKQLFIALCQPTRKTFDLFKVRCEAEHFYAIQYFVGRRVKGMGELMPGFSKHKGTLTTVIELLTRPVRQWNPT